MVGRVVRNVFLWKSKEVCKCVDHMKIGFVFVEVREWTGREGN